MNDRFWRKADASALVGLAVLTQARHVRNAPKAAIGSQPELGIQLEASQSPPNHRRPFVGPSADERSVLFEGLLVLRFAAAVFVDPAFYFTAGPVVPGHDIGIFSKGFQRRSSTLEDARQ